MKKFFWLEGGATCGGREAKESIVCEGVVLPTAKWASRREDSHKKEDPEPGATGLLETATAVMILLAGRTTAPMGDRIRRQNRLNAVVSTMAEFYACAADWGLNGHYS